MSWIEDFFVYSDTVFDAFGNHRHEDDMEYREFKAWKRRREQRRVQLSQREIECELNKPPTIGELNAVREAERLFRKKYGIEPPKLTHRQRRWLIYKETGDFS